MRAPASLFKVVRAAALAGLSALSISCAASVEATGDEDTTPSHTHKHRRHKDGPTEEPTAQSSSNTTGQVETVKGGAIHTLFHDDWFGGVTLLGVDAKKGRAVVRLDSPSPPRLNIDSIDLVKGARADRWSASEPLAKKAITSGAFAPLSESLDVDAARFAKLLRTLGPWHLRPALASPTFAVADSGDRFLYGGVATDGSNGDWLFSIPAGADKPERVDGGLAASYSPVFSPGGKTVAFVGCTASPCDYGLFFVDGDNGRPHRVGNVRHAKAPVWTKDGASVLVVGARASDRCLFKVDAKTENTEALSCVSGLEDVSFIQDPDGRTGALAGVRGQPGKQVVEVSWVLLENGTVLGRETVDRAVGSSVLSASGLLALPMQRGAVAVVDLTTGVTTLIGEENGWFFGFEGARWLGDQLVLLRKKGDDKGFDIVAIDVHKVARRDQPWL